MRLWHPSSLPAPSCLSWCLRAVSFPKVLSALGLARGRSLFLTSVKETPLSFRFTHSFQSKLLCGSEAVFSSVSIVRANLSFHSKKSLTYKASVFQTPDSSSFAFTSSENYWSSVQAPKETGWKGGDLSLHPSSPRGSNSFQGHPDLCLPRARPRGRWHLHALMRGRSSEVQPHEAQFSPDVDLQQAASRAFPTHFPCILFYKSSHSRCLRSPLKRAVLDHAHFMGWFSQLLWKGILGLKNIPTRTNLFRHDSFLFILFFY